LVLIAAALIVTVWGVGISAEKLLNRSSEKFALAVNQEEAANPIADKSEIQALQASNSTELFGRIVFLLTIITLAGTLGYRFSTVRQRRKDKQAQQAGDQGATEPLAEKNRKRIYAKRDQTMAILNRQLGLTGYGDMQVGHLMSKNVNTVMVSTPLKEVREWIVEYRYRHLLVCDSYGKLVGVISDRDLHRVADGTAADMMTRNPITVSSNQPVSPVITLMMDRKISSVPVVDGDNIVGILTTTDLMIALQCTLQLVKSIGELALTPSLPRRSDETGKAQIASAICPSPPVAGGGSSVAAGGT
jgi:acetoin utilization protein AcuB